MIRRLSLRTVSRSLLAVVATLNFCGCAVGSCGQEAAVPPQTDAPVPCGSLEACRPPPLKCTGTGAVAGNITDAADPHAVGGVGATAMPGDFYLANDRVRFVIQKPGHIFSTVPGGGNIIDADVVRASGEAGADELGELTGFVGGMLFPEFDDLSVVSDGSTGGPAVLRGKAHLTILEYMNLPALLGDVSGLGPLAPTMAANAAKLVPNIDVEATYALCPGDGAVHISYTLFNKGAANTADLKFAIGTFLAAAGEAAPFMGTFGFGPQDPGSGFTTTLGNYTFGSVGRKVAYVQRPYKHWDAYVNANVYGSSTAYDKSAQVTLSGMSITVINEDQPTKMLDPLVLAKHPIDLPSQTGMAFEVLFGVGRDLAEAQANVVMKDEPALGPVSGTVSPAPPDARVTVFADFDPTSSTAKPKPVSAFAVASDGTYGGQLAAGAYVFFADAPGYPRTWQKVTVAAGTPVTVPFTLDATGTITYDVTAGGQDTACRISVITDAASTANIRSNKYRDTLTDTYWPDIAYFEVSSVCRSSSTVTGAAGALNVVPGTYRIVVSRGPEFGLVDERSVTVAAGGTHHVTGDLVRQMATDGWLAIDLHQHAYYSFDSRLPHERRLTAYLAEGMEFFGSSEHDHVFDYSDLIQQMGYQDRLATMTGSEISPMHYGHFNAFELVQDPNNPVNGGSPDWNETDNVVVTPDALLTKAITAGADLISLNHPRAPSTFSFFYWADRCGLVVDFTQRTVGCNTSLQVVPDTLLDLDGTLFTDKFQLLELFNRPTPICRRAGTAASPPLACDPCVTTGPDEGRAFDPQVDLVLQDYLNWLQVGFIRTIVGNSDSHKIGNEISGLPRSYVYVGSGHDRPGEPNLKATVKAALKPADPPTPRAGPVVATNGPFVTATVVGSHGGSATSATIGGLLADDDGVVDVQVHLEAPDWMMDTARIEVFANDQWNIYDPTDTTLYPNKPADRSNGAIMPFLAAPAGAAHPDHDNRVLDLLATDWAVAVGIRSIDRTLTITLPAGQDGWIVVRVTGNKPMYPLLPDAACFNTTDEPAAVDPFFGTTAIAVTNPIFVEANGTAGWQPPAQ